jgi:hypothetical protein
LVCESDEYAERGKIAFSHAKMIYLK